MLRLCYVPHFYLRYFIVVLCVTAASRLSMGEPVVNEKAARVDFNRDIRSILSDKCFTCHGPDAEAREADLRLDVRDVALETGAIVPGAPDDSEIMARITSDDPDLVMPPPATGKSLSQADVALLTRWIQEDAPYAQHWAFEPPSRSKLPKVRNASWVRNPIDRFVLARLEANGQSPAVVADPEVLVRRLSLDLTGLPPSLDQLNRVTSAGDRRDKVIDEIIGQTLDSPHFGERWGRWWLDAARYADSAGYEKDMPRSVWFYRDWVINAMNQDKPYDEFVIEQIAGDLLPNATQSHRVATGFLRNSMTNEEGGADPEQFRVEGMFDRMDAIGKSILGITTQCAQCHAHKYDPLTHEDYYSMFAALNDFHEACITVFTPEQAAARDRVLQSIAAIESELQATNPDWQRQVAAWAKARFELQPKWTTVQPTEHPYTGQKFLFLDDGSIVSESYAPTRTSDDFSLTMEVETITAVRIDALTHPQLPRGGPGRSLDGTGALSEFKMRVQPLAKDSNGGTAQAFEVKFVKAISDVNPGRAELKPQYRDRNPAEDNRVVGPAEYAIDGDEKTAWTTDIGPGRNNQPRHLILVPEQPIKINGPAKLTFTMVQKHGGWNSDDNQNFLIGRYRFSITDDAIPDSTVSSRVEPLLRRSDSEWQPDDWSLLFSQWRRRPGNALNEANKRIDELWKQFPETSTQLVAVALGEARKTHVFARGDFLSPTEQVAADVPDFMHPLEETGEPDRLRFARWLVSPRSPTTARVIVNRMWQAYFGHGLVSTPEDFGFQSSPPSHPKLLDFLACELIDSGWSLKHVHRLIVDSATYRQSSAAPAKQYRDDPANRMLARGPRVRLEAEMIRDLALHASGLLTPAMGGPSIYPPAPRFLFQPPTSYGPKVWDLDRGARQYRRSIYVHQYRSVPYPPLQIFDAPKGDAACVRRERSNTPLQALVLLNEPQFLDAARALAQRIVKEVSRDQYGDKTDRQRIVLAHRLCTSRTPAPDEIDILLKLLRSQRDAYATSEITDDVKALLGEAGEYGSASLSESERAAWIAVARAVLNLDETITKS